VGRQVKAEWIKARSLRSTWIIVGLSVLGIVAQAITALVKGQVSDPSGTTQDIMSGSAYTLVLMVIIGVIVTATEYSQKSIISTYTVTPERWRPIVAKTIVVIGIALVIGAFSVPISRLVAAIWYAAGSGSWDAGIGTAIHYAYGTMLTYAGFAAFGVMIGVLVRSTAIGIGIAFAALFIIDPLSAGVTRYSEYSVTSIATTLTDPDAQNAATQPRFGSAIALLVLYVLVLSAIAIAIERRRDVD
jgi:ABC-2 type transport system permease protein